MLLCESVTHPSTDSVLWKVRFWILDADSLSSTVPRHSYGLRILDLATELASHAEFRNLECARASGQASVRRALRNSGLCESGKRVTPNQVVLRIWNLECGPFTPRSSRDLTLATCGSWKPGSTECRNSAGRLGIWNSGIRE